MHTLLAFRSSDGDELRLVGTQRLAYWELHDPGEQAVRTRLGLSTGLGIPPAPAPSP